MDSKALEQEWFQTGFPEPKSATKNQRRVINSRAHMLPKVLSKSEQVALRMMRFEYWLNNLSKLDATAIIHRIRILEEREKEAAVARRIAKKMEKRKGNILGDACSVCGGEMDEDPVAPTCKVCGKGSFCVKM